MENAYWYRKIHESFRAPLGILHIRHSTISFETEARKLNTSQRILLNILKSLSHYFKH